MAKSEVQDSNIRKLRYAVLPFERALCAGGQANR